MQNNSTQKFTGKGKATPKELFINIHKINQITPHWHHLYQHLSCIQYFFVCMIIEYMDLGHLSSNYLLSWPLT